MGYSNSNTSTVHVEWQQKAEEENKNQMESVVGLSPHSEKKNGFTVVSFCLYFFLFT